MSRLLYRLRWVSWGVFGVLMLLLLTEPVSVQAQAALSLTAVCGLVLLSFLPRWRWVQQLFLALGSAVVLRYLFWRLTSTLPPVSDVGGFTFGCILLAAELFCAFILAVSLLINVDPLRRKPLACGDDAELPTVDVLIASYNEDESILAMTICAAKGMDYPAGKLKVWLLDDGGTDQKCADKDPVKAAAARHRRLSLQGLCRELGATYLTRALNEHAKAGNHNNGLAHSTGEIVVVFDADHAPFRGFLRETIGYFSQNPKLFLVQTPHVFLNPDPIERNLRTFERMPSENEMFYGVTQRGLDKWNGSFFCGSAALLRRDALLSVGGFSGITITEDCESALDLHAQGWTSIYVDKPLITGLQPETFSSFIGQRSRWCQGMFQIFLLKNPLLRRGLKPIQRITYLSSMAFWFFPIPRLIFMIAPLLHIFFDIKIFVSSLDETIAYTVSYMSVNMLMQSYVYGHVRWPLMSELYEYVQGLFLIKALGSVAFSPRKPTFNVTSKGVSLDHDYLSELAWPYVTVFLLLVLGAGTAAWRYVNEPGENGTMLVVGIWSCFNLLVAGVALGVVAERRQTERNPRLAISRVGRLTLGGEEVGVQINHVSASACGVELLGPLNLPANPNKGATGWLTVVPAHGQAPHARVAVRCTRRPDAEFELVFEDLQPQQYRTVAELMYGDTEAINRFIERRRKPIGLLRGLLQFTIWGLTEPLRALVLAFHQKPAPEPAVTRAAPSVADERTVQPILASTGMNEASWMAAIAELSGAPIRPHFAGANADAAPFTQGAE